MTEIWKDVYGFEGIYQISNYGNVRSVDRLIKYSNGNIVSYKGQAIKPYIATNGYVLVDLTKEHKRYKKIVHRLVAEAFIGNPQMFPEVNHIDENKQNNHFENLEWCTVKYNRNFGTRNIRSAKSKDYKSISEKNRLIQGKRVLQLDKTGRIINRYISIREAEKCTGFHRQAISGCCHGKYKYAYGFKWEFDHTG